MRKGFTLVETLIALVLLQLSMLALGAGVVAAARDLSYARHAGAAAAIARNRVAWLRANPCRIASAASMQTGATVEHWRVEANGRRRVITDSVVFPRPGGKSGIALARAVTWCDA